MIRFCLFAIATLSPLAATAQDNELTFRFGLGPSLEPGYFGDADQDVGVAADFTLERLALGGLSFGGENRLGWGVSGSVRFIGERDPADFEELEGLPVIDPSLELGGGVTYTAPDFSAFANLRYGVIGHESVVAEIGGDYLFYPRPDITIAVGPRAVWADDSFAQTYFGVTDAQSDASAFDSFDAQSGFVSAGVSVEATYDLNEDWQLIGSVRYDQLQGDAADSPITESDEQVSTSVVLTRRFSFNF